MGARAPESVGAENEPRTRADWVDRKLREAILSGDLAPGQRLHTGELSKRWSVSQTPLREAMQRLAVDGLVEISPQRGARVAPVSLKDSYDVHELRVVLEPMALRSAMEHGSHEWLAALEDAYEVLTDELRRGAPDRGAIEESHRRYHLTLIEACDSPWLLRILDLLNSHIIRYWTLTAAPRRNTDEVLEEHRRIQTFVTEGKTDVAVAELTAHLQHALHSVAERMGEQPD
jgi:DNA-binding GntR family transcriptional regulator